MTTAPDDEDEHPSERRMPIDPSKLPPPRTDLPPPGPQADGPRVEDPRVDDPRLDDPRADEAVGHLQAAATEMIAAARAFLDLLEDVVEDPDAVASAANAVGSFARAAMKTAVPRSEYGASSAEGGHDDPGDGVHHIRIS